jgi:hypothetical protein
MPSRHHVTPDEFIAKWKTVELKERSAAHSHFIDLCRMLDEPAPTDADPTDEWHAFERGATKTTGGEGWADVWKRNHFGWEYKGKRKDLNAAFANFNSTPWRWRTRRCLDLSCRSPTGTGRINNGTRLS